MARIRSIKPEFCTSEQLADCSTTARLLFVLLWIFCDDAGRHPASAKRLKMECFPADSFSDDEMEGFINELISSGLIVEYEHNSKHYWQVLGWHHQKIDKPSYKYGPLNLAGIPLPIGECSANGSRGLGDSSPPDRSRSESIGVESISAAALSESGGFDETSASRLRAAEFLKLAEPERVTQTANKLLKACRSVPPKSLWQVAWIGCCLDPGFVDDLLDRMRNCKEPIRNQKRYLLGAVRKELTDRGFDYIGVLATVPPAPKVKQPAITAELPV